MNWLQTVEGVGQRARMRLTQGRLRGFVEGVLNAHAAGAGGWGPFNSQLSRLLVVCSSLLEFRPQVIIETGTYYGATTEFLASAFPEVPVLAFESNARYAAFASRRSARWPNVTILAADSASDSFAHALAPHRGQRVWAYLDAHWGESNPLPNEITVLADTSPDWLCVIDDAEVPEDPGFGFDQYDRDRVLTADGIRRLAVRANAEGIFYPLSGSGTETGAVRGTCYMGGGMGVHTLERLAQAGHLWDALNAADWSREERPE